MLEKLLQRDISVDHVLSQDLKSIGGFLMSRDQERGETVGFLLEQTCDVGALHLVIHGQIAWVEVGLFLLL